MKEKNYCFADFDSIPGVPCPCGTSRRAYIAESAGQVSFHVVDIKLDAQKHYHKNHTEIYYILEGEGFLELDDEKLPVSPGKSILIKPGCRHRALGEIKVINVSLPAFDAADEYFD